MKSVLCVHQGTEKYGSDRSFVHAVAALAEEETLNVEILLPANGDIVDLFEDSGLAAPNVRPLWILRRARLLSALTVGLPWRLHAVWKAARDLKKFDLVYVNTLVVIDFLLASLITRRPVIVHVREIPVGLAMRVFRRILILMSARVIFNSWATAKAFQLPEKQSQHVVYNGFPVPSAYEKPQPDSARPLKVVCVGRLNGWKGQEVLISACAGMCEQDRRKIDVRIIGGVYGEQVHFRDRLVQQIEAAGLENTVKLVDFAADPSGEYIAADIVVVPSTLAEPFGRVAVEGMAYGCVVLASAHGGLTEIVEDGQTGHLFAPGDANALRAYLEHFCHDRSRLAQLGKAARQRFLSAFTQDASDAALLKAFRDLSTF